MCVSSFALEEQYAELRGPHRKGYINYGSKSCSMPPLSYIKQIEATAGSIAGFSREEDRDEAIREL